MVPDVMGVLNATPDSFSDGGMCLDPGDAVRLASEMIDRGATFLDVGGESTRPGAQPVGSDEECARVLPVLEAIVPLARAAGVRVSIDTRHEQTARAAVGAGATVINDVSAHLWAIAAELGVGWVAMHMAGEPATMQAAPHYDDVVDEVRSFLFERAATATAAGVQELWVDPGIGFGKTTAHNMELLAGLDRLVADGHPVLVGTSRKRFLGVLLARSDRQVGTRGVVAADPVEPVEPVDVDARLDGSVATATWAIVQGARMVRAHDVSATVAAARIVAGGFPGA